MTEAPRPPRLLLRLGPRDSLLVMNYQVDDGPDHHDADLFDASDDVEACPHCGAEVYIDAEKCPACDQWITTEREEDFRPDTGGAPWYVWIIVVAVVALFILLITGVVRF